jgi:hypothetical protein
MYTATVAENAASAGVQGQVVELDFVKARQDCRAVLFRLQAGQHGLVARRYWPARGQRFGVSSQCRRREA